MVPHLGCQTQRPQGPFVARGAYPVDLCRQVAAVLDLSDGAEPERLVAALRPRLRHAPIVVVVDGVDEAADPHGLIGLLNDLAAGGARVLVGCREHLLDELADPDPIHVDRSPYLDLDDVTGYVHALLTASSSERAGLVESTSATRREAAKRRGRSLRRPADGVWLSATAALRRPYTRADLEDLLGSPAAGFLTTDTASGEGRRYRLFHQALGELSPAPGTPTTMRGGSGTPGRPRCSQSMSGAGRTGRWPRSTCAATLASTRPLPGNCPNFSTTPGYLAVTDLTRLLPLLLPGTPAGDTAAGVVLRRIGMRANSLSPVRRAQLLALTAAHLGLHDLRWRLVAARSLPVRAQWAHSLDVAHHELTGHTGAVSAVALGRVGDRDVIVSGGTDGTVRIWDARSGRSEMVLDLLGAPTACALGAPGLLCVAVGAAICMFALSGSSPRSVVAASGTRSSA